MPDVTLLGPQRTRPTVGAVVRRLEGPVAVITAGWQEGEGGALPRGLRGEGTDLALHQRAEQLFDDDRELFLAHRQRQQELDQLQSLYRLRLDHTVAAYKELRDLPGEGELVTAARDAALEAVRELDRRHLGSVRAAHASFDERWRPAYRDAVVRRRRELEREIDGAAAVVIAGGHVGALLDRLRLFDLAPLLAAKPLIAWSAGAMVAGELIMLFHDSPPWGAGNAEVLDVGLSLFQGVLPLPDARRRLQIDDPTRVALLARRFAPFDCIGLDEATEVCRDGGGWRARQAVLLRPDGEARCIGGSQWEALVP